MHRTSPHKATIMVTGLFVMGLLLGSWVGRAAVARATDPYAGLDRFARVLTAIESEYVEPIEGEVLLDAAIEGMVDTLDPHTRWMEVEAVRELEADSDGQTMGFGIEVGRDDRGIVVRKVLPRSPALRVGLEVGDRVLAIDGEPLGDASSAEVKALFEGSRGQESALTILREGWDAPQVLQTQRDDVHVPATESLLLDADVMYVRLIDFQHESAEELEADVKRLQKQAKRPWAGLILDLRDNTGGLLDEAVGVADLFLDDGPVVSVRGRREGVVFHHATPGGFPETLPVAVLVNGLSASASEIVSAALQEADRATLVGTQTYGKGSVQQLYRNPDGSALKLTIARYHTPSGAPIPARQGLKPDHPIESDARLGPRARLRQRLQELEVDSKERDSLVELLDALPERPAKLVRMHWDASLENRAETDPWIRRAHDLLTKAEPGR